MYAIRRPGAGGAAEDRRILRSPHSSRTSTAVSRAVGVASSARPSLCTRRKSLGPEHAPERCFLRAGLSGARARRPRRRATGDRPARSPGGSPPDPPAFRYPLPGARVSDSASSLGPSRDVREHGRLGRETNDARTAERLSPQPDRQGDDDLRPESQGTQDQQPVPPRQPAAQLCNLLRGMRRLP